MADVVMTLQEAADRLGVHYMTAYRYVRLGQLEARKVGGSWRVSQAALTSFVNSRAEIDSTVSQDVDWARRLESRLVAGDRTGSWSVTQAALVSGIPAPEVYSRILGPALVSIGDRWETGELDVGVEHRATELAARILGRLGPLCTRRGRRRGYLLIAAPAGERHALPPAMISDLIRAKGYHVTDLGADTPTASIISIVGELEELAAIGLSVTSEDNLESCRFAVADLKAAGIDTPVILGGRAIKSREHALELGADGYALDADELMVVLNEIRAA